jgi:hypothetical protein
LWRSRWCRTSRTASSTASWFPETEQKAATVGASVRALLLKATSYGISFDKLYGVEQTFAEVFEENPEFAYMAVTNTDGNVLYLARHRAPGRARALPQPDRAADRLRERRCLQGGAGGHAVHRHDAGGRRAGKPLGILHIGIDAAFVDHVLLEVLLDVVVVLVVSLSSRSSC